MTHNESLVTRRTALQTAGSAAFASIAGCQMPGGPKRSSSDGVLQDVAVQGTTLVVEYAAEADIDRINLVQPDGELFGQRDVAAGSEQVSFDIGIGYETGQYSIVAIGESDTVSEKSLNLAPDIRIKEMGLGRNQPDQMWDGPRQEIRDEAFVIIENTGSGPDSMLKLLFQGDVPYPSDEDGTNYAEDEGISGIYNPSKGREVQETVVPAGEEVTIYSSRSPFALVPGAGTSCSDETKSGEFELRVEARLSGTVSEHYHIEYSPSETTEECEISIARM